MPVGRRDPASDPRPDGERDAQLQPVLTVNDIGNSKGIARCRGEIERLQWTQADFAVGEIRIEATDCFAPKAESAGDIPIDKEFVELLKVWKSESKTRFVVDGIEPAANTDSYHYRADRVHRELVAWLHLKGITARNPLHSLRKEYGSIVCAKAGIYVASRLLRHANISMTAAVYTDNRGRVTPGLGASLSGA